jgi:hypothetical protein
MKQAKGAVQTPVMMRQSIKVFNADGTLKKDYGVVNYWHRNPLKRMAFAVKQFFKSGD